MRSFEALAVGVALASAAYWWTSPSAALQKKQKKLPIDPGECEVLGHGVSWREAIAAGSPVIVPLAELVTTDGASLDVWSLFANESRFDFSISPSNGFYNQVDDVSSPLGLRRNSPARMVGASWSLVREIMTYLVAKSNDRGKPLPRLLRTLKLANEYDPLQYGDVPLRHAFENDYRMYLSGESNSEMHSPSSDHLRSIQQKVEKAMGRKWEVMNAWVSAGNTMSNLHFDGGDNWLCQLSGAKTATMFPHADTDNLYPIMFNKVAHCIRASLPYQTSL
jgi:hypothetical protein